MSSNTEICGQEVGTILIHMYEENQTGLPVFRVQPENKHVLPISRTIENTLNNIN